MGKHTAELSPNQSVTTLLVSVEDLINMAMGPDDKNVVNFKLVQTVLHILARQMRLLQQRVEIRVTEYITHREKAQQEEKERERYSRERSSQERYSREPSRPKERSKSGERLKAETAEAKEKEKQFRTAEKERRNIERVLQKEKERAERAKEKEERAADRATSKEREKGEKAAAKDRAREERATSKEREKADKAATKEREREERGASKEKDKADKAAAKERERDERRASKERDKADKAAAKEREREDRGASKERDKADKAAAKERERDDKGASKERDKADKAAAKEREREERGASREREKADKAAAKEREREERGTSKEREKVDKAAAKEREREERGASREREKADKTAAKEREREEKGASKDRERAEKSAAKDREREEKAAAKADRDSSKDREGDERGASKERERAEKAAAKDREREEKAAAKADRDVSKERERDEKGASKEKERTEKAAEKEREREEKASAKADKAAAKEREREDRAAAKDERASAKEQEREDRAQSKEREKAEKAAAKEGRATEKEREKELKEAAKAEKYEMKDKARAEKEQEKGSAKSDKEMTKAEKAAAKEREREQEKADREEEKAERGQDKAERGREKADREKDAMAGAIGKKGKGADAGIAVKEEARDKEKVLVVEKGPITRSGAAVGATRSNIEVVTRSQFDLLKDIVNDLAEKAGPLPMPSMPQNKELLQRLSKGTASLTDMMDAMQVSARVVAAEQAIGRMGGILTQLATAGALPEDIAGQVGEVTTELEAELQEANERAQEAAEAQGGEQLSLGATSVAGRPSKPRVSISRKSIIAQKSRASTLGRPSLSARPSVGARASVAASMASGTSEKGVPKVTHPELDTAIRQLIEDLNKNMVHITAKSTASAENSIAMVKSISDKLETAMKVNSRITALYAMVTDYAEQLSGFDAGVTTQMQSFSEQIAQMRGDLGSGLKLLASVNNNAETAAVMELTERYEGLVSELDNTLQAHTGLDLTQVQIAEDLSSLLAAVEMLREQKADRDEVLDGLRDKADTSRLAGLLTEMEFYGSRVELERRLAVCHEKFGKQEQVWMKVIQDLKDIIEVKADLVYLLGTREEVQRSLEMLHEMCRNLALVLGEPKAAILTRKLTRGALCGACMVPALMSPQDAREGGPPRLPVARPRPAGAPAELCDQELKLPAPPDTREHMCNRWVGGSHTLISDAVSRLQAEPMTFPVVPTNRYLGQGNDGRLYQMEEELQPCVECNKLSDQAEGAPADGGNPNVVNVTAP